jgi:hypothetical protein
MPLIRSTLERTGREAALLALHPALSHPLEWNHFYFGEPAQKWVRFKPALTRAPKVRRLIAGISSVSRTTKDPPSLIISLSFPDPAVFFPVTRLNFPARTA